MERGNRRQRPRLCGATKSLGLTLRNMGGKERRGDKERVRGRERAGGGEGAVCLMYRSAERIPVWGNLEFVKVLRSDLPAAVYLLLCEVQPRST